MTGRPGTAPPSSPGAVARRRIRCHPGLLLALGGLVAVAALVVSSCSSTSQTTSKPTGVTAVREPLTTDPASPVAHDTELIGLASQAGRLFAATGQWEYPGRSATGQVLVKDSAGSPWKVFENTQSLRVQAIDSFPIPADQGLGPGHSLLVTQAIVGGRSVIQWLLDGASSFSPADEFDLGSTQVDVRSFGAQESGGVWAVYAGAAPTGILRGVWSKTKHTIVWNPVPEVTAAPGTSPGLKTQKVTGFADCAGALYVTVNTKLYRRNDGTLPPSMPRWTLAYQAPPVGQFNSGLRGVSCVTHAGAPSLLMSTEGNGNVYRFDHLPVGQLAEPAPGRAPLTPILEWSPVPALQQMLSQEGSPVPAHGEGAIDYVIAAYNNFETINIGGVDRQLFGVEHAYLGSCPANRRCGPTAFGAATFDAAACFAVRTDHGSAPPSYVLRCLSGPSFVPQGPVGKPIKGGQAFVSIRTIVGSPFGDGRIIYGGYDANFYPADGTAWVATSSSTALNLSGSK